MLKQALIPVLLMELGLGALYLESRAAPGGFAGLRWVAASLVLHALLCVWLYTGMRGMAAGRPGPPVPRPGPGVSARLLAEIAHEIRNPLHLINNLPEVNAGLAGELAHALRERPQASLGEVRGLIDALLCNARIVQRHGERAERIIRSVMAHARGGGGVAPESYCPTVTVRTWREAGQVEDNGAGIPPGVRARIFEPFFTTKPSGAGNTGLGLALSHDLVVQRHGGRRTVEREPGHGATFTVRLPTRPVPAARE